MRITEPTKRQERAWKKWVASRPPHIRAVAERFEPWSLYRLEGGHRVTIASFGEHEDGTVTLTVTVSALYNLVMFERQVVGVKPESLTPCDLPRDGELTGAMLSPTEADECMDEIRLSVRPDLWTRDPDTGKAVRKQ